MATPSSSPDTQPFSRSDLHQALTKVRLLSDLGADWFKRGVFFGFGLAVSGLLLSLVVFVLFALLVPGTRFHIQPFR